MSIGLPKLSECALVSVAIVVAEVLIHHRGSARLVSSRFDRDHLDSNRSRNAADHSGRREQRRPTDRTRHDDGTPRTDLPNMPTVCLGLPEECS